MTSKIVLVASASALALAGVLVLRPAGAGSPPPASPCAAEREAEYEANAATCGKVDDETEQRKCQNAAHITFATCRNACPSTGSQSQAALIR